MVVVNDINNQPTPADWFKSLPIVTQYWFGATVLVTLAGNFDLISPIQFMWSWEQIRTKFELWRIVSSFCYAGPFSFDTLITVCKYTSRQ
jgi:Derlin-2/3